MSKKTSKKEESIMNFCHTSGIEPWFIAKISGSPGLLYGAFHSEGINTYKFDKAQPFLTQSIVWENFTEATADLFFTKATITLKGDSHVTTLTVIEKGKDLVSLLRSNTGLKVNILDRPWWKKILGFRSGTKWKMALATVIYILLASKVVGAFNSQPATTSSTTLASTTSEPAKTPEQIAKEKADADAAAKQKADADAAQAAKDKADAEAKVAADKAAAAQALASLKSEAKTIPYKDLARNPDNYKGAAVKYAGKVVQVQEDGNSVALRVNVTRDDYGLYNNTVFVVYDKGIISGRVLEDDVISFWGISGGLFTYKTVMGAEMTIPQVLAKIVEVNN